MLARVRLAQGDAERARKAAQDAISATEKFSGRPTLIEAYAILGESLLKQGQGERAAQAYAQAASNLAWIQGSLLPEHVDSFMAGTISEPWSKRRWRFWRELAGPRRLPP